MRKKYLISSAIALITASPIIFSPNMAIGQTTEEKFNAYVERTLDEVEFNQIQKDRIINEVCHYHKQGYRARPIFEELSYKAERVMTMNFKRKFQQPPAELWEAGIAFRSHTWLAETIRDVLAGEQPCH